MIEVPTQGRPQEAPGGDSLVGVDGNAFSVIGFTQKALRRAGASQEFIASYQAEVMSGDYDHVIATSVMYLDAEAE